MARSPARPPAGAARRGRPRKGFVLLCAATYAQFVAMGVFLSALPLFITGPLRGSRSAVGLAVGAFSVSAVVLRPIVGRGIDQRGRRPFLVGGPLLLAVSSMGLLFVRAIPLVIALRLVQGVAGACYYTAGATVATDMAPENRRADYIARFSLFLYGGFATGPALGEFLVDRFGFNTAWSVAGSAALAAAVIGSLVPETMGDHGGAEADGVAGVATAGRAPTGGPGAAEADGPAGLALAGLARSGGPGDAEADGPAEVARAGGPVAGDGRRRFFHPAAVGPGFVILTAACGYVAISTFSPLYARHIGMASSGPLYVVFALTVLAVRLFAGRLADVYGREKVGLPALLVGSAAFALLALQPAPALAFVGVAAYGASFALLFPALMALTADGVRDPERGAALGSFTAFFDIGASAGSYAIGILADRFGFGAAFTLPSVLCLVGFAALLRIAARARSSDADPPLPPLPEPAGA